MKTFLILLILHTSFSAFALNGKEIAQKIYDSNRTKFSIYNYKMTLESKSKSKKIRDFTLLYQDNNQYNAKSLIVFTEPKKFSKTAMLTYNKKNKNSDQWLYLPALKKKRRISSNKKNGRFVGSDMTYEDFENREVDMDNHKLLKTIKKDNRNIYILESIAKDKTTSQYSKVISRVDGSNWTILSARFYRNNKTKVHKIIKNTKFKKIGKIWIAHKTIIKNNDIKHKTTLEIKAVKINSRLDDSLFTTGKLENQSGLKKYY